MVQPNRIKLFLALGLAISMGFALIPVTSHGSGVDVYAEGTYTATDLVIHIYADINAAPLLSFGVRIDYPAFLSFAGATKNEAVWYFRDGSTNHPYMNPENDGSSVVIIGGKLDTADPAAGVTGTRVLLGTVNFTHTGVTDFSEVILTFGRGDGTGDYKNFVATDGTVFDGVDISFAIHWESGLDSDGDGVLDIEDNCMAISNPDQRDTDTDGYGNRCDCDLDNNGITNFSDFGMFQFQYMTAGPHADFDGNSIVNFTDFGIFQFFYMKPPGPSGLVP